MDIKNIKNARLKLKKEKIPVVIGLVIGLIFIIYLILCIIAGGKDFISNTTINGIDVGNLTKKEAVQKIEQQYEKDKDKLNLQLSLNDKKYEVNVKDSISYDINNEVTKISQKYDNFLTRGYHYLFDHDENTSISIKEKKSLEKAIEDSQILNYSTLVPTSYDIKKTKVVFTKGKSGETVKKDDVYNSIKDALNNYDFKDGISISTTKVEEDEKVMNEIYDTLSKEAKNATLDKENNYAIVEEQYGAKYDKDESIEKFNKASEGEKFEVKATAILPDITKEMLEANLFKDVLGEYTTYFGGGANLPRNKNIRLSGEACNNIILLPGEEFSYLQTVGETTVEKGYGYAGAYLNGEVVQEIGGGICQTSSTIYNAVVLSNLQITERHNHTFISDYVPIGRDATVSWGGPDFKFKNNQKYPIKLVISSTNEAISAKVYGTNVDGIKVVFTSSRTATTGYNTKYEEDPNLPEGTEQVKQAGTNGAKAVSYRKVYDANGNLISDTKEANSSYKGHEAIIIKGTKKEETPATPPTPEQTTPSETPETDETQNT